MKSYRNLLSSMCLLSLTGVAYGQSTLEEIVVTAQKRAQSLQDVSVSVSAFTGDEIEEQGVIQPKDIALQTPNLLIKNAVGNTAPIFSIRGISLNDFATNGTQPVGVYVDEVYLPNNSQLSFQLFDVERVEVLKGPQGTLYGRNTAAGAVNFISNKPTDEFAAGVSATLGDYELFSLDTYVNGQLADNVSGRFSFSGERQGEGFFTNIATDEDHGETDRFGWRAQLLWNASESVTALLNVHGGRDRSDNWYYSLIANESGLPAGEAIIAADPVDGDIFSGAFNSTPLIDNDSIGATLSVDWERENFSIKSISSYEKLDYERQEDFDSTVLSAGNNSYVGDLETYSQEIRLSSNGGERWDWIVGAFYGVDELIENDVFNEVDHPFFEGLILNESYVQETTSFALYNHNEFTLNDQWKLTAGIRFTDEERSFVGGTIGFAEVDDEIDASEVTGKLGIDWNVGEDTLLYANYSRGYKTGGFTGFFTFVPEEKAPYNPEFIDAYEIGVKSTFADNTVRINGAAFVYEYTDLQAFAGVDGFFRIFNVDEAEITGAEFDLWWLPTNNLDIKIGLSLLDTEVTRSQLPDVAVGNSLANAPELQFNMAFNYGWELANGGLLKAVFGASYQDDVNFSITENPNQIQESYWLTNARLTYAATDERWSLSIWGKNLGDEEYFGEIFSDGALAVGFPAAPRTFGATLKFEW